MASESIPVTFKCLNCGGTVLESPDDPLTDESIMSCNTCGTVHCTYGELKTAAAEKAKEAVLDEVQKALGSLFKRK